MTNMVVPSPPGLQAPGEDAQQHLALDWPIGRAYEMLAEGAKAIDDVDKLQSRAASRAGSRAISNVDAPELSDLEALEESLALAEEKSALYQWGKAIFDRLDADGGGSLDKTELKEGLQVDAEAKALLGAEGFLADLDEDGEITWMEFEILLDKKDAADKLRGSI